MEELILAATSEQNTSEQWSVFIQICSLTTPANARLLATILAKRLYHQNINVVLYTLTLANSVFTGVPHSRVELASRLFLDAARGLLKRDGDQLRNTRVLQLIRTWADLDVECALHYLHEVDRALRAEFPFQKAVAGSDNDREKHMSRKRNKEKEDLELATAISASLNNAPQKSSSVNHPSNDVPQSDTPEFNAIVTHDYNPTDAGELKLTRGDCIRVKDSTTYPEWCNQNQLDIGSGTNNNGINGIFPANHVQIEQAQHTRDILLDFSKVVQLRTKLKSEDPIAKMRPDLKSEYVDVLEMRPELIKLAEETRANQGNFPGDAENLEAVYRDFSDACGGYQMLMEKFARYQNQQAQARQQNGMYSGATQSQYSNAPYGDPNIQQANYFTQNQGYIPQMLPNQLSQTQIPHQNQSGNQQQAQYSSHQQGMAEQQSFGGQPQIQYGQYQPNQYGQQ